MQQVLEHAVGDPEVGVLEQRGDEHEHQQQRRAVAGDADNVERRGNDQAPAGDRGVETRPGAPEAVGEAPAGDRNPAVIKVIQKGIADASVPAAGFAGAVVLLGALLSTLVPNIPPDAHAGAGAPAGVGA